MSGFAFAISTIDIETVLRKHWNRVNASVGSSCESLTEAAFNDLDHRAIEQEALRAGSELDLQTDAALQEIEQQLVELEVLSAAPAVDECAAPSAPRAR